METPKQLLRFLPRHIPGYHGPHDPRPDAEYHRDVLRRAEMLSDGILLHAHRSARCTLQAQTLAGLVHMTSLPNAHVFYVFRNEEMLDHVRQMFVNTLREALKQNHVAADARQTAFTYRWGAEDVRVVHFLPFPPKTPPQKHDTTTWVCLDDFGWMQPVRKLGAWLSRCLTVCGTHRGRMPTNGGLRDFLLLHGATDYVFMKGSKMEGAM